MKNNYYKLKKIKKEIEKNLQELCQYWNIYEKQRFFISAISIYDKYFLNSIQKEKSKVDFRNQIIGYGYSVFVDLFYEKEFEDLPGIVLKPIDDELLNAYDQLLYSCGIVGWINQIIDDVDAGFSSCFSILHNIYYKHNYKYHWNEYIENKYLLWYSDLISKTQKEQYIELEKNNSFIIEKMKKSVFVWNDGFIGYNNDFEVESFFNSHALLDAQQSTEWDMFKHDSYFGSVKYGDYLQTIVDFSGYSIKHCYFASIMGNEKKDLLFENLLTIVFTNDDLLKLISKNLSIDNTQSKEVLDALSLTNSKTGYYKNCKAAQAPLIKVSKTQYIRSIRGFLDRPFEFLFYYLKNNFPKEWSKNSNEREQIFREDLYNLFNDEKYVCINHPVKIKDKNGRIITDIDSLIIDKSSKCIALFQLKWQDMTRDSAFSLKSKMQNYNDKTNKWVQDVIMWINNSSEEEIAKQLSVNKHQLKKSDIYLFVIGRRHGTYPSNSKPTPNCAWAQWYQLFNIGLYLTQNNILSIQKMYSLVKESNPTNIKIKNKRNIFIYDKYKIIFD